MHSEEKPAFSVEYAAIAQVLLPIVRSWTGWNLLSVNCSNRHDFPTPEN